MMKSHVIFSLGMPVEVCELSGQTAHTKKQKTMTTLGMEKGKRGSKQSILLKKKKCKMY